MRKIPGYARAALVALVVAAGCAGAEAPEQLPPAAPAVATLEQLLGPWQPTPLTPGATLIAAADAACRAFTRPQGPLVLADARGGGVVQVFYVGANGDASECNQMRISPTGSVDAHSGGGTSRGEPFPAIDPLGLEVVGGGSSTVANGEPISAATFGRAGAGIARVQVEVAGQPPIVATLANGWFAAWWPGPPHGTVVGLDGGGMVVARLPIE